jgi:hypothetical protein
MTKVQSNLICTNGWSGVSLDLPMNGVESTLSAYVWNAICLDLLQWECSPPWSVYVWNVVCLGLYMSGVTSTHKWLECNPAWTPRSEYNWSTATLTLIWVESSQPWSAYDWNSDQLDRHLTRQSPSWSVHDWNGAHLVLHMTGVESTLICIWQECSPTWSLPYPAGACGRMQNIYIQLPILGLYIPP